MNWSFNKTCGSALFFLVSISYAGLGDDVKKVNEDKMNLQSKSLKITSKENFSVYEIEAPEYKIREYINSEKKVFAVAWSGLSHPELKQVLSSYYDEYVTVAQKQKRTYGKRFRVVKSKNVTLILSGHMRNLKGKVFLHSNLPRGLAAHEIK
jgi:hypothetical protein